MLSTVKHLNDITASTWRLLERTLLHTFDSSITVHWVFVINSIFWSENFNKIHDKCSRSQFVDRLVEFAVFDERNSWIYTSVVSAGETFTRWPCMSMGLLKSTHNAAVTLITHNATYHKALLEPCVHAVNVYCTMQIVSRVEKCLSETNVRPRHRLK